MKKNNIHQLPKEITCVLFHYFQFKALVRLQQVCVLWKTLLTTQRYCWKYAIWESKSGTWFDHHNHIADLLPNRICQFIHHWKITSGVYSFQLVNTPSEHHISQIQRQRCIETLYVDGNTSFVSSFLFSVQIKSLRFKLKSLTLRGILLSVNDHLPLLLSSSWFQSLQTLRLQSCGFDSNTWLEQIVLDSSISFSTTLCHFALVGTNITDTNNLYQLITKFPQLQELDLSDNSKLYHHSFFSVFIQSILRHVRILKLKQSPRKFHMDVPSFPIQNLFHTTTNYYYHGGLTELYLENCGLKEINYLPRSLQQLHLPRNHFVNEALYKLLCVCPSLTYISVNYNHCQIDFVLYHVLKRFFNCTIEIFRNKPITFQTIAKISPLPLPPQSKCDCDITNRYSCTIITYSRLYRLYDDNWFIPSSIFFYRYITSFQEADRLCIHMKTIWKNPYVALSNIHKNAVLDSNRKHISSITSYPSPLRKRCNIVTTYKLSRRHQTAFYR